MRSLGLLALPLLALAALPALADAPVCSEPNRTPRVLVLAKPSDPPDALKQKLQANVEVIVRLADDGTVRVATAASGPELLRNSAEDAARRTTFEPELKNCVKTGGLYTFVVEYDYTSSPTTPAPAPKPTK